MNTTTVAATRDGSSTRRIEETDNGMVIIEESGNEIQEQDWVDRHGLATFLSLHPIRDFEQRSSIKRVAIRCKFNSTRLEVGKRTSPDYAIWCSYCFRSLGPNAFIRKLKTGNKTGSDYKFPLKCIFRQSVVVSTDHLIGYSQTPIRRGFSVKFLKLVAFQKIAKM